MTFLSGFENYIYSCAYQCFVDLLTLRTLAIPTLRLFEASADVTPWSQDENIIDENLNLDENVDDFGLSEPPKLIKNDYRIKKIYNTEKQSTRNWITHEHAKCKSFKISVLFGHKLKTFICMNSSIRYYFIMPTCLLNPGSLLFYPCLSIHPFSGI